VAPKRKHSINEKSAPQIIEKGLKVILRLIYLIGKPLYSILSYLTLFILFIFYITGYTARTSLAKIAVFIKLPKSIFKRRREKIIYQAKWGVRKTYRLRRLTTFLKRILYKPLRPRLLLNLKTKIGLAYLKLRLKNASISAIFTKSRVRKIKLVSYFSISLFYFVSIIYLLFWNFILKDLPPAQKLTQRPLATSTKIYDRNGILLYTIFKDQNRTLISLKDTPQDVRSATIAVEDAEFYSHPGFSLRGITRSILRNLKRKELTGGSTITQQLVKNALLTPEKTFVRKLREIVLAIQVELTYSKDEILEMYLNEVAYGGTAYGIQEAARMYFDKDAKNLTLAEAALLAGLPKSPTRYSPLGPNPEAAFVRQKEVLKLMQVNGFISEEQRLKAEGEKINVNKYKIEIKAPHFVFFVREGLEEKFGKEVVESGGLTVVTTLDYRIQKMAEEAVREEVEKLAKLNVGNGAALVLNSKSGEILAMVGSKDFFDAEQDGNVNVVVRPRQPGSSIKVVNYAYGLENGLTASAIIQDSPVTFIVEGQPPYTPKNYDGRFRGNLSLRSALAESRNIPAVKILAESGVKNMVEQGQKMGITTWDNSSNYGLSLTLGGGEIKLIDLSRVYATLANYGVRPDVKSLLSVTSREGKILEESKCAGFVREDDISFIHASGSGVALGAEATGCNFPQVLDPRVAYIITDILRDNAARSPAFGSNSLLLIPNHKEVAVKTGTSNDLRDNLAIGYTEDYVVAVWVGNNNNSQMARIASGVTGATPIWNRIISTLLAESENHEWQIPQGLMQLPICTLTGNLTCEGCPTKMEWFLAENQPTTSCDPEYIKTLLEKPEGQITDEVAVTENLE